MLQHSKNCQYFHTVWTPDYKITLCDLIVQIEKKEKILGNYYYFNAEKKREALKFLKKVNKNIKWIKKQLRGIK